MKRMENKNFLIIEFALFTKTMNTTIKKLTIIITLLFTFSGNANPTDKKNNYFNNIAIKTIPIIISSSYFLSLSSKAVKHSLKNQLQPENLLINLIQQILFNLLAKIAHEFGHGLTAKLLNNNPIRILLGKPEEFQILNTKLLKINGLNLKNGYCKTQYNKKALRTSAKEKLKYGLIYFNGAIFGILSMKILERILKDKNNIHIDPIILENIFHGLIPISQNSDATKIYTKCFNISNKTIDQLIQIYPLLYIAAELYLSHKQSKCFDVNFLDKFFLTIINLSTKNFLRFHV